MILSWFICLKSTILYWSVFQDLRRKGRKPKEPTLRPPKAKSERIIARLFDFFIAFFDFLSLISSIFHLFFQFKIYKFLLFMNFPRLY
ncbi:hypothetical protein MHP7448_0448 [Mesomycoplasma hyopneumoniae 7448]|uniref:Uncharacterized protein n=1 Tax=Mesomycoplasma hyopneumoniae (strain 7448) TaxID=262722 RepID=Q4A7S4_MESH7|nr:hypothetical protein MHP7448_0448 [Mesomycoplasma hyopneumoniae 7448]